MTGTTPVAALRQAPQAAALRAPRLDGRTPPTEAALQRAATQFETQALGILLQPVFATADASRGPFGGGPAEAQWRPMLVDAYAAAAVRAGGLGIAQAVFRELRRQADRATAPSPATPRSTAP